MNELKLTGIIPASSAGRVEFSCVRRLYEGSNCFNKGLYQAFSVQDPVGEYCTAVVVAPAQHQTHGITLYDKATETALLQ